MTKTLYYYNVFITYNGEVTNIHLAELLDNIKIVDVKKRVKSIKQGNICLLDMKDPYTNSNDVNDRKVVIGRFRENKPFIGNLGTERIDEIPDDVVELTSLFYRNNSRLLIVEYNHHGVRPNGLRDYLDSFLPASKDDTWSIELDPIEPKLGFNDVSQSKDIKNIDFKIDLTARNPRIYKQQLAEDNHRSVLSDILANTNDTSVLGNILANTIDTYQEFGANYATVGFSNGRKWRKNVIDAEQLIAVLRALDLESDVFESIKVVYFSPATKRKEELDLKNQGILKDFLDIDENGWEYICDNIEKHFYNNGRLGENNHQKYTIEVFMNLPNLKFTEVFE